jgi:hypothetical protein
MEGSDRYVLVQGPAWGDAHFYGDWLLAAATTEVYRKESCTDENFKRLMDRVCVAHVPDFGVAATVNDASVCIVDDAGRIIREVKVASEPDALLAVLAAACFSTRSPARLDGAGVPAPRAPRRRRPARR